VIFPLQLLYAFPKLMNKIKGDYPKIFALHERIKSSPKISAYLASDRHQAFNEYGVFRHYPELDEA
jgi:glutathione S-transferase